MAILKWYNKTASNGKGKWVPIATTSVIQSSTKDIEEVDTVSTTSAEVGSDVKIWYDPSDKFSLEEVSGIPEVQKLNFDLNMDGTPITAEIVKQAWKKLQEDAADTSNNIDLDIDALSANSVITYVDGICDGLQKDVTEITNNIVNNIEIDDLKHFWSSSDENGQNESVYITFNNKDEENCFNSSTIHLKNDTIDFNLKNAKNSISTFQYNIDDKMYSQLEYRKEDTSNITYTDLIMYSYDGDNCVRKGTFTAHGKVIGLWDNDAQKYFVRSDYDTTTEKANTIIVGNDISIEPSSKILVKGSLAIVSSINGSNLEASSEQYSNTNCIRIYHNNLADDFGAIKANRQTTGEGILIEGHRTVGGQNKYNTIRLLVNRNGNAVVTLGGTGVAASWRKALELGDSNGALPLTIAQGGTGKTNAYDARKALKVGTYTNLFSGKSLAKGGSADLAEAADRYIIYLVTMGGNPSLGIRNGTTLSIFNIHDDGSAYWTQGATGTFSNSYKTFTVKGINGTKGTSSMSQQAPKITAMWGMI